MRAFIALVIVAALGFYVAWPAWSGYQIKSALDRGDAATLGRKIDFPSVKTSLTPYVTQQVKAGIDDALGSTSGALTPELKDQMAPKIAEAALNKIVTPETLVRVATEGTSFADTVRAILKDQVRAVANPGGNLGNVLGSIGVDPKSLGGLGSILGGGDQGATTTAPAAPAPAPAPAAPPAAASKASYSLANTKSFSVKGPADFEIGVNRDASAPGPEVKVEVAFTGGDWKVVGIRPQ